MTAASSSFASLLQSAQAGAEALDALAGILQQLRCSCIGDAEERRHAKGRTLDDGHTLGLEEFADEILVSLDLHAAGRGLADGARAGRIDIERAFRCRAGEALRLV